MQRTEGKAHWFGEHPGGSKTNYEKFAKFYNTIDTEKLGIEIINCSTHTAITCFPRMDLKDVLNG
jgi:hypothetical protein